MMLAAIANRCLPESEPIELINVSFGINSFRTADRKAALTGLAELQHIAPNRVYRFLEVDVKEADIEIHKQHIYELLYPCVTLMDFNIGAAFWFAAGCPKTTARVLILGNGADESLCGYSHHRKAFGDKKDYVAVQEEIVKDLSNIWRKNLGRDDRCIADHGKESRLPFLDEDVLNFLNSLPLWCIADLTKESGTGEKLILREMGRMIGLTKSTKRKKAAIQHGSKSASFTNNASGIFNEPFLMVLLQLLLVFVSVVIFQFQMLNFYFVALM